MGDLPAVGEARTVSLDLPGLQPGSYGFYVHASNAAGNASSKSEFTVPTRPPGACPNGCDTSPPYTPETPTWFKELSERESAQTLAEYEAKQRQLAQEQEAARVRAASVLAAQEAALRQPAQETASAGPVVPACSVPPLRGKTLSAARRALAEAHCRLGKVSRPTHRHQALFVIRQSLPHGKRLPGGATVAVVLGPARRPI